MGHRRNSVQQGLDLRLNRRISNTTPGLEHDTCLIARFRGEPVGQEVVRVLGVGPRNREGVTEFAFEAHGKAAKYHQKCDPCSQHFPSVANRKGSPSVQRAWPTILLCWSIAHSHPLSAWLPRP